MDNSDLKLITDDIVLNVDLLSMLVGEKIGQGQSRMVFQHNVDPDKVVKLACNGDGVLANSIEWTIWQEVQGLKGPLAWVKDWFCPVHRLSGNSNVIVMSKTAPVRLEEMPKEVPTFLSDIHMANFGWLDGRVVCHDYGFIYGLISYKKKFKKAAWQS